MSEMVERVALAISGGDDPASILEIHRYRARDALAAMREPTDAMLMAMCGSDVLADLYKRDWQLAIDEALK